MSSYGARASKEVSKKWNTMTTDPQNSSLSARGSGLIAGGALADKWKAILGDSYDAEKNPNGIVNMGTSENVSEPDVVEHPVLDLHG